MNRIYLDFFIQLNTFKLKTKQQFDYQRIKKNKEKILIGSQEAIAFWVF